MLITNSINKVNLNMTKKAMCESEVELLSRKVAQEEIEKSPLVYTMLKGLNTLQTTVKDISDRMWVVGITIVCSVIGDIIIRLVTGK